MADQVCQSANAPKIRAFPGFTGASRKQNAPLVNFSPMGYFFSLSRLYKKSVGNIVDSR